MRAAGSKEIANRLLEGVDSLLAGSQIDRQAAGDRKVVCRWFRFAQLAKGKKFRP